MKSKLDSYEAEIEKDILKYKSLKGKKKAVIEDIIEKSNEKKSINLRIRKFDLEQLKRRAKIEGLPYQTLLSSVIHKFVTDQLIDKKSILKSIEFLKAS